MAHFYGELNLFLILFGQGAKDISRIKKVASSPIRLY